MFEEKSFIFKRKLKYCGKNVKIYAKAQLIKPHAISIGDYSQIDDFTWILGGRGITIGRFVHIAAFVSILGGGEFIAEDHAGLSSGCRIVTGTDDFLGNALTGPMIPAEFRNVSRSYVILRRHVVLGTNVIVHPGVEIGEGAVVGSGSLVLHDIEPWTVNIGTPAKAIKARRKDIIPVMREQLDTKLLNTKKPNTALRLWMRLFE